MDSTVHVPTTPVLTMTLEARIFSLHYASNRSASIYNGRGPSIRKTQCLDQIWTNTELTDQILLDWDSLVLSFALDPIPYIIGQVPEPSNQSFPCQP